MASKTPTYGKDLPGNLGNTDILRAIYDKVDRIHPTPAPTDKIEQKLDTLIIQTDEVNNNIIQNTQAIKDVSVNVIVNNIIDIDTSKITKSIDDLKETNNKGFTNINNKIANINNKIGNLTQTYKKQLNTLNETINAGFNKTEKAIESLKSSQSSSNTKTIENSQEQKSQTKKNRKECKLYGHWMFLPYPNYYNLHFETPESKLDRERKSMKVLESPSKCNTNKVNNKVDWSKLYEDYIK